MERDRIVFYEVRRRGIPIVMVTSGGYQVRMGTLEPAKVLQNAILVWEGCHQTRTGL